MCNTVLLRELQQNNTVLVDVKIPFKDLTFFVTVKKQPC